MLVVLGAITARGATSGVSALVPSKITTPAPPLPALDDDMEGYSVAGSGRFIVIGRPGREVLSNSTNIDAAGQVVVWELEEGYRKQSWTIDMINPRRTEFFGGAVAAGDRWIAVSHGMTQIGVPYADGLGTATNRVQLIEFPPDGGWLPGPDLPNGADAAFASQSSGFGNALAMDGSRLVVSSANAAFVYEVSPTGVWTRTQRIDAPAGNTGFSSSMALKGDLLVLGAPGFPVAAGNGLFAAQGGIYIYRKGAGGLFVLEQELRADDGSTNDYFGSSVAVDFIDDAEVVAVGAKFKDVRRSPSNLQPNSGAAYIYRRALPNGSWALEQQLTNFFGTLSQNAYAGLNIALSNGRLSVGADSNGGSPGPEGGGAVAFFYRDSDSGLWIQSGDLSYGGYYRGLAGFPYGFLIGDPGYALKLGQWEWRTTDPYSGFINQPGVFVSTTPGTSRRSNADPDGDGALNSEELFFGTDPLTSNTNRILRPSVDTVAKQFKMQWQQATATFGLKSTVMWSTNMTSGTWTTNGLQIVDLGLIAGTSNRRYEARVSNIGRTNAFFRILVE